MLKALIFDMDGVLVMSTNYNWQSFKLVWKKHGVDLPEHDAPSRSRYLGRSLKDQILMVKEEYGVKEDIDLVAFSKETMALQLELMNHELVPNIKALNIIKDAKRNNLKVAVATASSKDRARTMLSLIGVFDELDVFISAADVETHKPAPDVYLKTAERLNVEPESCIVFEDAINGILAAKLAGMQVIGYRNEYVSEEEMLNAGAIYCISDLSELNIDKLKELFHSK